MNIVTLVHEDSKVRQAHKTVLFSQSLVSKMTMKRKLGTDSKSINNGTKAPNVETKKKVLTKNELMLEFKALEKKYDELLTEKDNLLKKLQHCRTRIPNQA